jgi:transposase-like protein
MGKRGFPSAYTPQAIEAVAAQMAQGYSLEAAASLAGVPRSTLYRWLDQHPESREVIHDAQSNALAWWENRARAVAEGEPGNSQIISLGVRNRARSPSGWHHGGETQRVEHTGADGGPIKVDERKVVIDVTALDGEQREQLRALLLATQAPRQIEAQPAQGAEQDDDDASASAA